MGDRDVAADEEKGTRLASVAEVIAASTSRHTVHRFTSSVGGDGFDVDVQIVVSGNDIGPDVYELSEHAQALASRLAALGRGSAGRPNTGPFTPEQPPF